MFWFYIGIGLLLWVLYDLITGSVWSFREIKRSEEPGQYWFWMFVWVLLALSVLYPYLITFN